MITCSLSHIIGKRVRPRVWAGRVLEVGPGRIWPGQRLLRNNPDLDLVGLGYSQEQRTEAWQQAKQWGLVTRVEYHATAEHPLPLEDRSVDAVISFGGLQAWKKPVTVLNEIARVLKTGGGFFIGGPRPDAPGWRTWLAGGQQNGLKEMYQGRQQNLDATELRRLAAQTRLENPVVEAHGPDVWILKP